MTCSVDSAEKRKQEGRKADQEAAQRRRQDKHLWIRRYRAPKRIDLLLQRLMEAWKDYKQLNEERDKPKGKPRAVAFPKAERGPTHKRKP